MKYCYELRARSALCMLKKEAKPMSIEEWPILSGAAIRYSHYRSAWSICALRRIRDDQQLEEATLKLSPSIQKINDVEARRN